MASSRIHIFVFVLLALAPLSLARVNTVLETVAVEGPREKLCEACTQAVTQLDVLLSDPEVMNQSIAVLEGTVCSQLPGDLEEQCASAVEEYVPLVFAEVEDHLSVVGICVQATHLCPPTPPAASAKGPEDCLACRLVVKLLRKHLDNPKTQAKIEVYLEERCSRMTNSTRAAQCTDAVDKYLPLIFANIDVILNEKKLCKEAGLCPVATHDAVATV